MNHSEWRTTRTRRLLGEAAADESPAYDRIYEETGLAIELGQLVHDRRKALGLSQTELAHRAAMTQPQVSKLELGGTVPTLPLLARLARALDASLDISLDGAEARMSFIPHAA
jgi:ribosome-binding protein aMBF1 (putative translation factor)